MNSAPTTIDDHLFNEGMAGFVDKLGLSAQTVTRKETGELMKTLVKITPQGSREKIAKSVESKIGGINRDVTGSQAHFLDQGNGDTVWFAASKRYLFGVSKEKDMRKSSVDELRETFFRVRGVGGRWKGKYETFQMHRKGNQKAAIMRKVMTTNAQRKRLITRISKNIGRLAAGWLSGMTALNPSGKIPEKVLRHRQGARGWFIDSISDKTKPSFTMANTASGIGSKKMNVAYLVRGAISIRSKAMAKNLFLFTSGKKHVGDYK